MSQPSSEIGESRYCPACHKPYPDWAALKTHLQKAQSEGDTIHIEVIELEGWDVLMEMVDDAGIIKGDPDEIEEATS